VSPDIFEGFCWHSSIGIDSTLEGNKRFVTRLPNTKVALSMFVASGNNLLIHKTTRCLWKMSDDKKTIEPVFSSDVLSLDEVQTAMEGSEQ
jgi:hypothetical protein